MKRHPCTLLTAFALASSLVGLAACTREPGKHADIGHDDHLEEDLLHEEDHRAVHVSPAQIEELGIVLETATSGELAMEVELPGEVRVNADRLAHVAPRVGGVAHEVRVSLGDEVREGELLAVIESRELADAKSEFLAARQRLALARATADREERLWAQSATSQQDLLDARTALAELEIALRAAEQTLHALGLSDAEVAQVAAEPDGRLTMARLIAPFAGTVVEKHISIGETIEPQQSVLTIADLSVVWVDLSVYQKDLPALHAGQEVMISTDHVPSARGEIDFVQPIMGESTRTALARVVMPNPDGLWHPGCFVTAQVSTSRTKVPVRVPRSALLSDEVGDPMIFVRTEDGDFRPREVEVGRSDAGHVEIVDGLAPGETYVASGGFALEAELGKDAFGGHAH